MNHDNSLKLSFLVTLHVEPMVHYSSSHYYIETQTNVSCLSKIIQLIDICKINPKSLTVLKFNQINLRNEIFSSENTIFFKVKVNILRVLNSTDPIVLVKPKN
jgi:hypothetical protein